MRDYTYSDYFNQTSIGKQIKITWADGELTNTDLYSESFTLTESLNSSTQLDFGSCEASSIEFTSFNIDVDLTGVEITVSITPVVDGEEVDEAFIIGKYIVYEDTLSGDRSSRTIKAYDAMYDVINTDVMEWYQDLDFPLTLKEFRTSFFEYLGITQESATLINDDMEITQTVLGSSLTGQDVIHAICEINGCFGTIKQGVFYYVFLPTCTHDTADLTITKNDYKDCTYSDYVIKAITGLKIVGNTESSSSDDEDEEEDTSDYYVIVVTGDNMYVIEENFLLYDKTDTELIELGEKMFDIISGVSGIRPVEIKTLSGNPCVELGDSLTIEIGSTRYDYINTCVLQRTLTGIQALTDTYKAEGEEKYTWDSGSTSSELRRLWGQTQALLSDVEDKGIIVITGTNESELTISSAEKTIVELDVYSKTDAIPIFICTIPLTADLDGEAIITTYIDSVQHIQITGQVHKGKNFLTLTDNFTISKDSTLTFAIKMKMAYYETDNRYMQAQINNLIDFATGGTYSSDLDIDTTVPTVTIADSATIAEIFLQGGDASDIWNGKITASDIFTPFEYGNNYKVDTSKYSYDYDLATQTPQSGEFTATFTNTITYGNTYAVSTTNYSDYVYLVRGYTGLWGAWVSEAWSATSTWTWGEMGTSTATTDE